MIQIPDFGFFLLAAPPEVVLWCKLSSIEWFIQNMEKTPQFSAVCTLVECHILLYSCLYSMSILSFQIILDVVPTLPDIPLPPIQANYRPLPSIESITCSQTKRKGMLGRKMGLE